tara:strand:- start:4079 stop:5956 length:1878 start_codon:yes stop_codon:yes gene_type:complete
MSPRNRKMFRPRNAGRQAAGILASSPQLMQTVQKRNLGGINVSPQQPGPRSSAGFPDYLSFLARGAIPGANVVSNSIRNPVRGPSFRTRPPEARTVPGGGLGSFVTGSGEVNPLAIASTTPSFRTRPPEARRSDFEEFITANLGTESDGASPFMLDRVSMTSGEDIMNRSISGANTQSQPTEEKSPEEKLTSDVNISTVKVVAPSLLENEKVVSKEVSSNEPITKETLKPVDPSTIGTTKTTGTDIKTLAAKETLTPEDILNVNGSMVTEETSKGKADIVDEAIGNKGTLKQRMAKRLQLQKEILGDDVDIRDDANYAAMMFGLALASGTSGDFKTDLAEAGKQFLKMRGEQNTEKRKEQKALAISAMNSVLDEQAKEEQRKFERRQQQDRLGSQEQIALMQTGTQKEIALAGIVAQDQRLEKNINNARWLAEYNAGNEFKLFAAKQDQETRLATFSALEAFKRAQLGAQVQINLADMQQENLNNRLEAQLETQIDLAGQDSAEVKRIQYLLDNPQAQDLLIKIAKESKTNDDLSFDEQLALKLAGNDALMFMPGGANGLAGTLKGIVSGEGPSGPGVLQTYNINELPDPAQKTIQKARDEGKDTVQTASGTFLIKGNQLVPKED